jgi:hypothetical protein
MFKPEKRPLIAGFHFLWPPHIAYSGYAAGRRSLFVEISMTSGARGGHRQLYPAAATPRICQALAAMTISAPAMARSLMNRVRSALSARSR